MAHTVNVALDPARNIFYVAASNIEGLHAEAASPAEIVALISERAKSILRVPAVEVRTCLPAARPRFIAG
jgi:hypothetical protein